MQFSLQKKGILIFAYLMQGRSECAYGQLKGRFRELYVKSECNEDTIKAITLACIVLYNICIEYDEAFPMQLDQ